MAAGQVFSVVLGGPYFTLIELSETLPTAAFIAEDEI